MVSAAPTAAATAPSDRKVRKVWNVAQRARICSQSEGSVASVQVAIMLSIGTSTARVITMTATASANQAATVDLIQNSSTTTINPTTTAEIMSTSITVARFSIMCLPSARKVV